MAKDRDGKVINLADALKPKITAEINVALQRLGAPFELLSIVGSWGDTLSDSEVLEMLQSYNAHGTIFDEVLCSVDHDED